MNDCHDFFGSVGVEKSNQLPIDASQALLFCDLLGKKDEETHIRAFPHKKSKKRYELKARSGKILTYDIYEIEKINLEERSVYAVVNDGGTSDSDITDCRAIFCEWGDKSIEWQIKAWKELGLPEPTFQVLTGGKAEAACHMPLYRCYTALREILKDWVIEIRFSSSI